MQFKRLRRIRDGLIYPFNINMAKVAGMEVVMCDERNRVISNLGEEGEQTVHGIKYTDVDRVPAEQVEAATRLVPPPAPPAFAIPAESDGFDGEVRYDTDSTEPG